VKTVNVRDLQKNVRACVSAAQKQRLVVTRHGRPAAVLIGVEGQDWESVSIQTNPDFWRLIGNRRKEKTIPLAEMRRHLARTRKPAL
jgi:prevent-host-death family protein